MVSYRMLERFYLTGGNLQHTCGVVYKYRFLKYSKKLNVTYGNPNPLLSKSIYGFAIMDTGIKKLQLIILLVHSSNVL